MSRSRKPQKRVITVLLIILVAVAVFIMMPKDAYAASSQSCDEGIPTEKNYVESIGKWRLLPPLTRATYDVSVEVFGIYQECWYDYYLQIDEGNPIVIRVQNDVSGSLLDDPVVYTFAYRHQYYSGDDTVWTPYTYVQYQGSFNLAKFNPVIPNYILDDFNVYVQSELYVGCKDVNNHIVRKYFNFICLNKGTESDYNSAILGLGSDLDKLESTTKEGLDGIATGLGDVIDEFQTSEVSVSIDEPSYIVDFRETMFQDSEPSYIMPDPCPDVFLLQEVYNAFMPSEIAIFSGSALLLLLCGWWLRQ